MDRAVLIRPVLHVVMADVTDTDELLVRCQILHDINLHTFNGVGSIDYSILNLKRSQPANRLSFDKLIDKFFEYSINW